MLIDISRNKKSIFSNPFNFRKLGVNCASTAYVAHIKRIYKLYPERFEEIKGAVLVCKDEDCWPKICHMNYIKSLLNKSQA